MQKISRWAVMAAGACSLFLVTAATALAAEPAAEVLPADARSDVQKIGLGAAAAFAIAMSIWGAAFAVARIGSAAMGAAAEKPELLNRSLLFVALAEGLAVLGFVIAIMLVQKI
jgi:V/A-type H+-transporting ATPase subunit K